MNKLEKALRNKLDPETAARLDALEAKAIRTFAENVELQVLRNLYRGGKPPEKRE